MQLLQNYYFNINMFYFDVSNVFHYKTGLFLFTILSSKFSLTRRTLAYFIYFKNARQKKTTKMTSYPFSFYRNIS